MNRRLRIPTEQEIEATLKWGGIRILIAIPQAGFWTWKQLSRLSLHLSTTLDNLYYSAVIEPFDALIWQTSTERILEAQVIPDLPGTPELFDWDRLKTEPDTFPHIRIIAKSGMGKTTLAEWLLSILGGQQFVITPKKKPTDWRNHQVFGAGFNFDECADKMEWVKGEMYNRFAQMEEGIEPGFINFVADEWRLVVKKKPTAKEDAKEVITVARDAKIRMIAIAQGEQVSSWGLEGESDLEECFTTIRLGQFAIDYAKKLKLSATVLSWLQQQKRPCMVENQPALVPDLKNYQLMLNQSQPNPNPIPSIAAKITPEPTAGDDFEPQTQNSEDENWQLWELIEAIQLAAPDRSDDWLAKNIIMPRRSVGRPKAIALIQELRTAYGK